MLNSSIGPDLKLEASSFKSHDVIARLKTSTLWTLEMTSRLRKQVVILHSP